VAFARVELDSGESARVAFRVPADLASFTGREGRRIVEPGELAFQFGRSAGEIVLEQRALLTGATREVGQDRRLHAEVEIVRR
jgi:beta-xylosidase